MSTQNKGVAVHALVIVILMGFFALVAIFLFYKWAVVSNIEANTATCAFKKIAFCTDWRGNNYDTEPWTWDDKAPKGCEDYGITKPDRAACDELI